MPVQIMHADHGLVEVDVLAKVTPRERVVDYGDMATRSRLIDQYHDAVNAQRHWWREFGDTVLVWHFLQFKYDDEGIDEMMNRAAGHKTLIIDLRNNGGGSRETSPPPVGAFLGNPTPRGRRRPRARSEIPR